jgi:hypothetical protein
MTTLTNVRAGVDTGLQAVNERGWRRGFVNLLGNENRMWWRTRKCLIHLLLWLVVINVRQWWLSGAMFGVVALLVLALEGANLGHRAQARQVQHEPMVRF